MSLNWFYLYNAFSILYIVNRHKMKQGASMKENDPKAKIL